MLFLLLSISTCFLSASSLNNGLARTPPMGWRSWNFFHFAINQSLITAAVDALTDISRPVYGTSKPTSLVDIGYNSAGVDDGWQLCDHTGHYFHNDTAPNGWAVVNPKLFPKVSDMIAYAHKKNVQVSWYFNNCRCSEHERYPANEVNDVAWLRLLDFDGVKLDGCGSSMNTSNWNRLFNKTGPKPFMIEDGGNYPSPTVVSEESCPMNFFGPQNMPGINPAFPVMLASNLYHVLPYNQQYPTGFISRPGCWAFPGDLEVGNIWQQYHATQDDMDQTHFSAWCVISSPLILGMDITNKTTMDRVWDTITNPETIAVSQNFAGHPGRRVDHAQNTLRYKSQVVYAWDIWAKPQPNRKWAVLLTNNDGNHPQNVTVKFDVIPWSGSAHLRDIVSHTDLGTFTNSFTAVNIPPFGSRFFLFS